MGHMTSIKLLLLGITGVLIAIAVRGTEIFPIFLFLGSALSVVGFFLPPDGTTKADDPPQEDSPHEGEP